MTSSALGAGVSGESHLGDRSLQGPLRHLVIARAGTNLAAEDPIRPRRISDDHRQQKKRADEEKRLRAGCGGRIPQTYRMGYNVRPETDYEPEIAHREQRDCSEKRQKFGTTSI